VLLVISVYNLVFWLPSFTLDWFLFGKMSDRTLALVNTGLNLVLFVGAVRLGFYVYGMCFSPADAAEVAEGGFETVTHLGARGEEGGVGFVTTDCGEEEPMRADESR